MDSWTIVQRLEKEYPTPSLHLDHPIVDRIRNTIFLKPLRAMLVPKVPKVLLNKSSADYFYLTREEALGKPLDQVEREVTEKDWEEAAVVAKEIADLLKENGGPFFLGEESKSLLIMSRTRYG